jgi:plastocyanin
MRLRSLTLVVLGISFALLGFPSPASAGGCGRPASHGTGTTVAISKACFTPSLLTIDAGATVTFVNRDPIAHNVGGQLWGHFDDLEPAQRFQATFGQDGIYPFACTLHPGMTGAIIVGDGVGAGNGAAVQVRALDLPAQAAPAPVGTVTPAEDPSTGLLAIVVALLVGLAIGVVATTYRLRSTAGLTPRSARP